MDDEKIKMYVKELRFEDLDQSHLDEDRMQWRAVVNTTLYLRVPQMR